MARETEAPLPSAEAERIADEATREAQRKGVRTTGATLETIAPVEPVPLPPVEVTAERTTLYDLAHQLMGASPGPALAERGARSEQLARRYERAADEQRQGLTDVQETAKAQEHARAEAKPAPLKLPGAPSTAARPFLSPGESVLSQIQTAILGVGQVGMGIAGLKGRGHAIAAMSALKGATEGWQAGDADRVQRNLAEWQTHAKKLLAEHQAAREAFDDLLTDQKMAMDTKLASIRITAEIAGNEGLAEAARLGNLDEIIKYGESQQALGVHVLGIAKQLDQYRAAQEWRQQVHRDLRQYREQSLAEHNRRFAEFLKVAEQSYGVRAVKAVQPIASTPLYLTEIARARLALESLQRRGKLPQTPMVWSQLGAQLSQGLTPNDPDLAFVRFIETPLGVGLWDRQLHDEKGARAMAAYKAQTGAYLSLGTFQSASRLLDEMDSSLRNRFAVQKDLLQSIPGTGPLLERIEREMPIGSDVSLDREELE